MDEHRLLHLLNKQAQATLTAAEQAELQGWYTHLAVDASPFEGMEEMALASEMLSEFRSKTKNTPAAVRKMSILKIQYWMAAASVILILLVGSYFIFNTKTASQQKEFIFIQPTAPAAFIRQIILPDGSKVVLKPNSTLRFTRQFTGNTRTVVLSGEAFFDVAHNPAKPFIIRTGEVTTTVLGTAFNVVAWPGEPTVAVTVTRGKVKVSNQQKTLALLTADQQIVYNLKTALVQQKTKVEPVTGWLKTGMSFTDQTMGTIVPVLQQRFQRPLVFDNTALQNCSLTASFDGTETLEQVLDVLCLTINAKYQPQNEGYLLIGEGCQ